jgi:hypothetical protein
MLVLQTHLAHTTIPIIGVDISVRGLLCVIFELYVVVNWGELQFIMVINHFKWYDR